MLETGDFHRITAFKSYGVKKEPKSQYANERLTWTQFLLVSCTVEAPEGRVSTSVAYATHQCAALYPV